MDTLSELKVRVEKVGGYMLHPEVSVNLFRIKASELPETEEEIKELFIKETGYYITLLGVEGCPGRWYTSRISIVHVNDIYNYALIEVVRCLDV